jgi:phosphatidyl-myo-inositol dimannoside synthase
MRVALFSNTIDARDGYGNITFELSHALAAKGIDLTLFLPKTQTDVTSKLSLPFATSCTLPSYLYRIFARSGPWYFKTTDVSGFDLVHDLFAFPYCIPAALSARKYRKPFMTGAQGTHGVRPLTFWPEAPLLRWCYRQAKAIAVPSEYTKRKILEHAGEMYDIDIIHNGVRFDRFTKTVDHESVRKRYPGKRLLLTVGGLWGRKGHDLVMRALPTVRVKHPDTMYVIVGDGSAREELTKLAEDLGVRDMVDFAGRRSGDDLVAHFRACDIYVHTPKVIELKFEGFGIVYLEASACGRPIVATDAGGIRDAIEDGKTGLIADDGDVAGIADRIIRLFDDPALARRLGEAGREYAQKHDWSRIAEQYVSLYEKALN